MHHVKYIKTKRKLHSQCSEYMLYVKDIIVIFLLMAP